MERERDPTTLAMVRRALRLVAAAGRRQLTLILAASVVTSLAIAGQLLIGRAILDLLSGGSTVDWSELVPYLAALGVLLVVAALSQAMSTELRLPLSEQVHRRTMNEVLDVATEVELEAYEGAEFHDTLERARMAAGVQSQAIVFGLVTIFSTAIVAAGVVAVLVSVAPILVPIAVLGYLPIALVNVRNNRARYRLEVEQTELIRERSYLEFVMTDRAHAGEIRSYGISMTLRGWYARLWDTRLAQLYELVSRRLLLTGIGSAVTTLVLVLTLGIALGLAANGTISIGDAAVAIVGLQQLSSRLQSAAGGFNAVHEGTTFFRDFDRFRSALPSIRERRPRGVPPSPPTVLQVEDLGYRYPGSSSDALRSVSFQLERGQVLAIVGANGSGKSTLAKLLGRLLPPTHGRIRWDGVDLAECDPALVRAEIAPVLQEYARYYFTIRETIGLGDAAHQHDVDGILLAAKEAGAEELIDAHAAGLDTRLGKMFTGGVDISLGQWQRLAIARALFRDAPVVIMDEPSASLDPRAEAELFDLLQSMCEDRIVIFVSHRFATVRTADRVLVMDQGEVVETGTHDELMAAGGLYRDLFTLQAERFGS